MEKISVIIPSYNHNRFVIRAVNSALNLIGEKDIIVVDDGSEVPIKNIWGHSVTVLRHSQNAGLSHALNTGIQYSKTNKFVILAADDTLNPDYIRRMTGFNEDIISCDMLVGGLKVKAQEASLQTLMRANCHSYAALIKKKVWEVNGGFKTYMNPSWEDYEFFLNAAKNGFKWKHVHYPLHEYTKTPNGRDATAQGKDYLLRGKLEGSHTDLFGKGKGLVTFVIPCYNHEQYLEEAINSCLNQIYPHVAVVVVDDESPGDPLPIIKKYPSDKVFLVRQKNKHLSGARNTGIRFALSKLNSEYLVMLDADDEVHPSFIEETMGCFNGRNYVYTDIKLIGDAWHNYDLPEYDPRSIIKNHLHPCTFLMPSQMYKDIVSSRGYGYDETMKKGYEDWEFALAALQNGWCGLKRTGYLFNYRNHVNGSMRTEATKINNELYAYIRNQHRWIQNERSLDMACKTCGGKPVGRVYFNAQKGTASMMVQVPGIGEVPSTEPIQVTYTGTQESEMRKIGRGLPGQGRVLYKYSANPNRTHGPQFTIIAIDTHLFVGPYTFSKINTQQMEENRIKQEELVFQNQQQRGPVQEINPILAREKQMFERPNLEDSVQQRIAQVTTLEEDDLTQLKHIGEKGAQSLQEAGLSYFRDIAKTSNEELSSITGLKGKRLKEMKESAEELVGK